MTKSSGDEEFERERDDYFERMKGSASTPAGDFNHSNFAAGDLARWHPATISSTRSQVRPYRIRLMWLVSAAVILGIVLGFLIARSLG